MVVLSELGLLRRTRLPQLQFSYSCFPLAVPQCIHGPVPSRQRTFENTSKDRSHIGSWHVDHVWHALLDALVSSRRVFVLANLTFIPDMFL